MRSGLVLAAVAALAMGAGCLKQATAPVISTSADAQQRNEQYSRWKLEFQDGVLTQKWRRADGEYVWPQLETIAESYPETKELRSRAQVRAGVISVFAGAGGAIAGYTFGYNLSASESDKWSSGTQLALYGTAAGLILVGVIINLAWHNPAEDFATVYNRNLAGQLGISERRAPARPRFRFSVAPSGIGVTF